MSVGKPFSEPYGTLEALRQFTAVWNEGRPTEHFGAQLEADRLVCLHERHPERKSRAATIRLSATRR
jgi:hypothetical protein